MVRNGASRLILMEFQRFPGPDPFSFPKSKVTYCGMALNLEHLHRVHCIGLGGIGVSAVAKLLRLQGKEVSGSDLERSLLVEEAEAVGVVYKPESADNISPDLDLVIYTSAAPETHPERVAAAQLGITQFSYAEFLGLLSDSYETIAVSGTNGKSTTTAMLGLILEAAGLDPLVIVGSRVASFPHGNLRPGQGKYFVVEACEHKANFLNLNPKHLVVTNISEDHLDYYKDLAAITAAFQKLVDKLPEDGLLVLNADDRVAGTELLPHGHLRTFGSARGAAYRASRIITKDERTHFVVERREPKEKWPGVALQVPGRFNALNALAAATVARELGVAPEVISQTLESFPGIWRRFERVGVTKGGAPIISDYGHHPDAVRGTLEAAREFYPNRRVVLVFQPHLHDRTRKLFKEFVASFDSADALVLAEIYGPAGRTEGAADISSRDLVKAVEERDRVAGRHRTIRYAGSAEDARGVTATIAADGDLILIMGAGDIYAIAPKLVA